jgi:peroxiredoxin/gas vesicle protein
MKRYLILTTVAAMVLLLVWPAIGQQTDRENRGILSPEERAKLRERWTTMSEEERQEFRKQMRDRMGTPRPAVGREDRTRMTERFKEQTSQMREEHEEFIGELKAIRDMAVKEKAKKTVERLDKLIEKHQKKFDENMAQLAQRRQRLDRMMRDRPRTPGTEGVEEQQTRGASPFTLSTFDGKKVSLSDYRGKIVVLEWLNFECPFVNYHYDKSKTMIKLAEKYKGKNVVWLAVNSTSHTTPEANKDFAQKQKLPYPILDDRSGRVGRAYGAKTTPHMYVINRRGRIVYEGAIDNAPLGKVSGGKDLINYVDKALAELTTGRRVSAGKTDPYGCSVKYP